MYLDTTGFSQAILIYCSVYVDFLEHSVSYVHVYTYLQLEMNVQSTHACMVVCVWMALEGSDVDVSPTEQRSTMENAVRIVRFYQSVYYAVCVGVYTIVGNFRLQLVFLEQSIAPTMYIDILCG